MTKSIFITGASSGIGMETAMLFANKGWQVFATIFSLVNVYNYQICCGNFY